ncbi:unnamed protein product [Protopolystoma xenopodis]|uniref:Uncharacterized protein n=1 Tax=Protopolystoma xenopodis TaxID=117903 RepID=A0A3S5BW80_9PLAT|nr:unnamed protein product [Protopolystoma xenopodis]
MAERDARLTSQTHEMADLETQLNSSIRLVQSLHSRLAHGRQQLNNQLTRLAHISSKELPSERQA